MEKQSTIEAHNIKTPINLVAAWLTALCVITASVLGAAVAMPEGSWMQAVLTVSAVANVPMAFLLIFRMQTRHRTELLADDGYLMSSDSGVVHSDHFRWAIDKVLREAHHQGRLPVSVGQW